MHKIAVVTGASKGIGRETAVSLAQKGHRVIAVARSTAKLENLKKRYPDHIDTCTTDLTKQRDVSNLTGYLSENYSTIDILVNNAGALVNKPFATLSKDDWHKMFDVNVFAVVDLTKALLPLLGDESHIVNISSMGGFQGSDKFPGLTAYSVAKGAVSILSECLAAELAEQQISVNALCLGSVQTPMFETAFPDFEADVSPQKMGTYIAEFALNGAALYNGRILPVAMNNPS